MRSITPLHALSLPAALLLAGCSTLTSEAGPESCRHVNAHPLTPEDSWSAIQRRAGYLTEIPKVQLGNTFVPVTRLCVDGDDLRTVEKVERCTAYRSRGEDDECVATEETHLRTPIEYTQEICTRWRRGGDDDECVAAEARAARHLLSYEIPVYAARNAGEGEEAPGRLCFTKTRDLPPCDP